LYLRFINYIIILFGVVKIKLHYYYYPSNKATLIKKNYCMASKSTN